VKFITQTSSSLLPFPMEAYSATRAAVRSTCTGSWRKISLLYYALHCRLLWICFPCFSGLCTLPPCCVIILYCHSDAVLSFKCSVCS